MKKRKTVLALGLGMVLGFGLLAGCGSAASSSGDTTGNVSDSSAQENAETETAEGESNTAEHLNIATQTAPAYLPLTILEDKGWLEEALEEAGYGDVEVTFTEFESGPPENESFAADQQDVGVMGNVPSISGVASGQERTFIGISSNGEKTQAVLVPTGSDISSVEDLEGKTIGLVVGSISQNFLDTLLEDHGLSISDVELVNLGVSELQSALTTEQVDAVATWEPTLTKLQSADVAELLADGTGIFLGENTIFSRTEYLEENPEIVQIFMEQYARAVKELVDHKDDYAEQYADKYGLEVEIFKTVLENAEYPFIITEEDVEDLQGTADFLYREELISAEVDVASYVDYSFSEDESILSYLGE